MRWIGRTRSSLRENATMPLGHFKATQLVLENKNQGVTAWRYKRPPKHLVGCALGAGDNPRTEAHVPPSQPHRNKRGRVCGRREGGGDEEMFGAKVTSPPAHALRRI